MTSQENTQSKYRKNRKPTDQPKIEDNEVRITTQGRVKKYVDYSLRLLQGSDPNAPNQRGQQQQQTDKNEEKQHQEDKTITDDASKEQKKSEEQHETNNTNENIKKFDTIVLKATGLAINKAVVTAEVVKRRVGGLHQVTDLKTLEIEDTWDPLEEGLHVVKTTRRVASIIIKLSCDSKEISTMSKEAGYQAPIANESIKPGSGRRGGGTMGQQGGNMFYSRRGGGGGFGGSPNRMQGGRRGGRGGFRGGNRQGGGFRGGSPNRGQGQGGFRGGQGQGQGQGGFRGGGGQGFRGGRGQGGRGRGGFRGGGQGFRGGRGGRGGGQFRGGMRNQQQGMRNQGF